MHPFGGGAARPDYVEPCLRSPDLAGPGNADAFDGELYLRLLGERTLLSGGGPASFGDALVEQARVLETVAAVTSAVARRVVDDYARAGAVRGLGGPPQFPPPSGSGPPSMARGPARRIVPCRRVLSLPTGEFEVRHVILGQHETRLAITFRTNAGLAPGARNRPAMMPAGVTSIPTIAVTDDRGKTVSSSAFSGGGTAAQWRGFLTLRPALAPDTAWIELYGERVELRVDQDAHPVTIEHFTGGDLVGRCLDQRLAASSLRPHGHALSDGLQALVAAGLVDPAGPAVAEILAVHQALTRPGGSFTGSPGSTGPQGTTGRPGHPAGPWHTLLARRGSADGPTGTLVIGAATPTFEGISAVLLDLVSTADKFTCDVELTGPAALEPTMTSSLDAVLVMFSAVDDRGNVYLGQVSNWGGQDDAISAAIDFWPALDPGATRLVLFVNTDRARAAITVPLTWGAAT